MILSDFFITIIFNTVILVGVRCRWATIVVLFIWFRHWLGSLVWSGPSWTPGRWRCMSRTRGGLWMDYILLTPKFWLLRSVVWGHQHIGYPCQAYQDLVVDWLALAPSSNCSWLDRLSYLSQLADWAWPCKLEYSATDFAHFEVCIRVRHSCTEKSSTLAQPIDVFTYVCCFVI